MPDDRNLAAMRAYYERGEEEARLADGAAGQLEFERTKEIVLRDLPPAPAVVADIGGGPGRYTHWLAGLGYQVVHRDLMPLHVAQVERDRAAGAHIDSAVADARDLDLAGASVDAVLLLGPLYHLERRPDRLAALAEARRIARPGAPVFAAAINRWAMRLDDVLRRRRYEQFPHLESMLGPLERTGQITPVYPGSFVGYAHRPDQLRSELRSAGLHVTSLVSVEGPAFLLGDLPERLADADGPAGGHGHRPCAGTGPRTARGRNPSAGHRLRQPRRVSGAGRDVSEPGPDQELIRVATPADGPPSPPSSPRRSARPMARSWPGWSRRSRQPLPGTRPCRSSPRPPPARSSATCWAPGTCSTRPGAWSTCWYSARWPWSPLTRVAGSARG